MNNIIFKDITYSHSGANNRTLLQKGNVTNFKLNIKGNENLIMFQEGLKAKKIAIQIEGDSNIIFLEKNVCIKDMLNINIKGDANGCILYIGASTFINRAVDVSFTPAGPGAKSSQSFCYIGYNNYFNGKLNMNLGERGTNVIIGNNCLFANQIRLNTSDSHSIYDTQSYERLNPSGDIQIGHHCWICNDVNFLNHTSICNDCVVATGSIVTKKFANSNVLIGGVPAKIIREKINWDRQLGDCQSDYTAENKSLDLSDRQKLDPHTLRSLVNNLVIQSSDTLTLLEDEWHHQ